MNPGKLRHPIVIEVATDVRNEFGEPEQTWTEFEQTWAEIKPIKAGEFFSAVGTQHEVTHRIVTRYIEGIKPDMRIRFEDRIFEITAIRNFFERDEYLEILAKERCGG